MAHQDETQDGKRLHSDGATLAQLLAKAGLELGKE